MNLRPMPDDDPIATSDQNLAEQRDFAHLIRCYYDALLKEGFERDDALILTGAYQGSVIAASNR
jgi:hypothetical protein